MIATSMTCTISWNVLPLSEWQAKFKKIRRSNILQSYEYACAQFIVKKQKNRLGVIFLDGVEAGFVQVIEASTLMNYIHAIVVDRGPLWFEGYGSDLHFSLFVAELDRQFPKRFGRRRRFLLESEDSPKIRDILKNNGFHMVNKNCYETIWIDLTKAINNLYDLLKKNWRGALKKAERNDVVIEWDNGGAHLSWLLGAYERDRVARQYDGPPVKLMRALGQTFSATGNMLIGRALYKNKPIGAVLIFCHGASATYQIGWSGKTGRDLGAHYLLLWDAMNVLKNKGIKDFDLGGVNDEAKGVKKFKSGMGGDLVRLPPIHC